MGRSEASRPPAGGVTGVEPLDRRRRIEIEFWRDSPTERPESNAVENVVNKAGDAAIFLDCLRQYGPLFARSGTILELGAGQGWASCIAKRVAPQARVIATDISPFAVASAHKWERIFEARLDGATACPSDAIDAPDASVDLVFCFAAAHHFVAHRRTLLEVRRVLRNGGSCLYLYEPSCPAPLHALARRRVNRRRPEVPEDVLVPSRIAAIAAEVGLACEVTPYPSVRHRRPFETLYYALLAALPPLQRVLPCTAHYHFRKPA